MAKLEKNTRSAKSGRFLGDARRQAALGQRVVKPAPMAGSFSRAEAKSAVIAVMRQHGKKGE